MIRSSLAWTSSQFLIVTTVEMAGLAILARLLRPADMGVYAVAFAIIRFGMLVGNFGLHPTILRADTLDTATRRQVTAIGVIACGLVFLAIVGLALARTPIPLRPEEAAVLLIMTPALPLNCFSTCANAELVRDMRFRSLFWTRLISAIIYPAIAIPLALSGLGAKALATGYVVSVLVFTVSGSHATNWVFLRWPDFRNIGEHTRFAGTMFVTTVLAQAAQSGSLVIIGRLAGVAMLGQFSRANDIVNQARNAIQEVALRVLTPHVFDAARKGRAHAGDFNLAASHLSIIIWPASALLSVLAGPIVRILLGDQWDEAIPALAVLALSLAFMPLASLARTYATAMRRQMRVLVLSAIILVLSLALVSLAAPRGVEAIAATFVVAAAVDMIGALIILNREVRLQKRALASSLLAAAAIAALVALPALWLVRTLAHDLWGDLAAIAGGGAIGGGVWLAMVLALRLPARDELVHGLRLVRLRLRSARAVKPE